MTLWLILALMTAAAAFSVVWPLARGRVAVRSGSDVAIYRDQLDEIERDRAAGLIGKAEAEAARVEVSRRLLAAADTAEAVPSVDGQPATWRRGAVAVAALLLLPVGAGALYLSLGSPDIPSESLASRQAAASEQRSIEAMVVRVEAYLERNPEDGRGWEVLAPVYLRSGRFEDAVNARRNALRLLGSTAAREADLGEALVSAARGTVTAEAKAAFERAAVLDAEDVMAQFYLALAAEQEGRREDAAKAWRALLARAPQGAPWIELVQNALARVDGTAPPVLPAAPVNTAVAPTLPPNHPGGDMVRGMVERLAERLKTDGSNLDGWVRLVRSYMVLGEADKARAAAADARRALAADPDKLRQLDEQVKGLGLEG
jgi:cytochrome c-type biogenesis protein CcmH